MDEDEWDEEEYEENDWEDDDYGSEDVISNHRAFDECMNRVDWSDKSLLGLEIETFIDVDENDVEDVVLSVIKPNISAEYDGSLHYRKGVEFIFVPIPFDRIDDDCIIKSWAEQLTAKGGYGWETKRLDRGNDYGMHISVNAGAMSQLHVGKFCHFIHTNRKLCTKIGGRSGRPIESWANFLDGSGYNSEKSSIEFWDRLSGKYLAAAKRSNTRIETRFCRSSLHWPRIKRNCEFIDAIRNFTEVASVDDLDAQKFIQFVSDKETYPLLNAFIGERSDVFANC
jgi:hypothetical protein